MQATPRGDNNDIDIDINGEGDGKGDGSGDGDGSGSGSSDSGGTSSSSSSSRFPILLALLSLLAPLVLLSAFDAYYSGGGLLLSCLGTSYSCAVVSGKHNNTNSSTNSNTNSNSNGNGKMAHSFEEEEEEEEIEVCDSTLQRMSLMMPAGCSDDSEDEEEGEGEDTFDDLGLDPSDDIGECVAKLAARYPFMRMSVAIAPSSKTGMMGGIIGIGGGIGGGMGDNNNSNNSNNNNDAIINKKKEKSRQTTLLNPPQCPRPGLGGPNGGGLVRGKSARLSVGSGRLPSSYAGRNSLFLFSSSQPLPPRYSLDKSTQENYGVGGDAFFGKFAELRMGLDLGYHGNYNRERQEFQDKIVEKMLDGPTVYDSVTGRACKTPTEPWVVFTAGVMGAGKSHTLKTLASRGLFPLKSYIVVDPDEIRSHFPEYHLYATRSPRRAGELTHREAGYISEIVTAAAMGRGYNVLVDGSLRDHEWYGEYFRSLRESHPGMRIAILHITAPREAIFDRAKTRARKTGRIVPIETLEMSLKQVPISVRKLAPLADFFCELDNSPSPPPGGDDIQGVTMTTDGMTWDEFRDNWAQRGKM